MNIPQKRVVAIIGGRTQTTTPMAIKQAERAGSELGRRGIAIICGGEDGIMEAACRGCQQAGGLSFGVMKGNDRKLANTCVDYPILTSMDLARNNIIIWSASGVLAFDGMYGTLTETALTLDIGKPLVSLGTQRLLDISKIDSPYFAHYQGYDLEQVPTAVDHLLCMIEEYER